MKASLSMCMMISWAAASGDALAELNRTTTNFQIFGKQNVGDGGFPRARQAREENRHALAVARRIAAAQLLHYLWISEPAGDIPSFVQTLAQFGPRDVKDACAVLHLI